MRRAVQQLLRQAVLVDGPVAAEDEFGVFRFPPPADRRDDDVASLWRTIRVDELRCSGFSVVQRAEPRGRSRVKRAKAVKWKYRSSASM
jgi:hypothetical protein